MSAGREQEVLERDHAGQPALGVDGVDREHGVDRLGVGPDRLGRLSDGRVERDRDDLGRHQAARRVVAVAQQRLDVDGVLQLDQHVVGLGHVDVGQHVGLVVGGERVDERDQLRRAQPVQQVDPLGALELGQDPARDVVGEPAERDPGQVGRQVLQERRDVGRAELGDQVEHVAPVAGLDQVGDGVDEAVVDERGGLGRGADGREGEVAHGPGGRAAVPR